LSYYPWLKPRGQTALEGGAEALLTKPIDFVAFRTEIDGRVASAA